MAGILANTTSVIMASSEGVDVSKDGYVAGELCVLSVEPAGSSYLWTLATPGGSRSRLSGELEETPRFKMDRGGIYVVTVVVDGSTVYKIRAEATDIDVDWSGHGVRLSSVSASDVPTPSSGYILFINSDNGDALSKKDSGGIVTTV